MGVLPWEIHSYSSRVNFHNILQLMENGFDVSLVFFDLRKAFDSVPHLPLLQKLKDIGLNQHILQWIASYLCNRQQYVVVDGASSDTTSVLSGVPQGSVLGPLLFLTYINHVSSLTLTDGRYMYVCVAMCACVCVCVCVYVTHTTHQ